MTRSTKIAFTAKRVAEFQGQPGAEQSFLWDTDPKGVGLGLRVKGNGRPVYIFQSRYQGKTVRITIGRRDAWTIPEARARARELQMLIDSGRDPRVVNEEVKASNASKMQALRRSRMTLREVWDRYLEQRRPLWSDHHYHAHVALAQPGGEPRKRSKALTKAGPLAEILQTPIRELNHALIRQWAERETQGRASSTRLALRLLKAFLRWMDEQPDYTGWVDPGVATGKRINEVVGRSPARRNALRREQLAVWFLQVQRLPNPVISAYLQSLLLTGARREELAALRWEDVDFRWRTLKLADKFDDQGKEIPLTPYVAQLLRSLPRRNEWVFSSPTSQSGRIVDPKNAHKKACEAANLSLSIHDLRRSFKSLSEWLDIPTGVIAQIMGHRPSATAEKHYTVRPVDMLRAHHERFEAWILEQANVKFVPSARPELQAI